MLNWLLSFWRRNNISLNKQISNKSCQISDSYAPVAKKHEKPRREYEVEETLPPRPKTRRNTDGHRRGTDKYDTAKECNTRTSPKISSDSNYWKHREICDVYAKSQNLVIVVRDLQRNGNNKYYIKLPLNNELFLREIKKKSDESKGYVVNLNERLQKLLGKVDYLLTNFRSSDSDSDTSDIEYNSNKNVQISFCSVEPLRKNYKTDTDRTPRYSLKKIPRRKIALKNNFDWDFTNGQATEKSMQSSISPERKILTLFENSQTDCFDQRSDPSKELSMTAGNSGVPKKKKSGKRRRTKKRNVERKCSPLGKPIKDKHNPYFNNIEVLDQIRHNYLKK